MFYRIVSWLFAMCLVWFYGFGVGLMVQKEHMVNKKEPLKECINGLNGYYWCYDNIILGR